MTIRDYMTLKVLNEFLSGKSNLISFKYRESVLRRCSHNLQENSMFLITSTGALFENLFRNIVHIEFIRKSMKLLKKSYLKGINRL